MGRHLVGWDAVDGNDPDVDGPRARHAEEAHHEPGEIVVLSVRLEVVAFRRGSPERCEDGTHRILAPPSDLVRLEGLAERRVPPEHHLRLERVEQHEVADAQDQDDRRVEVLVVRRPRERRLELEGEVEAPLHGAQVDHDAAGEEPSQVLGGRAVERLGVACELLDCGGAELDDLGTRLPSEDEAGVEERVGALSEGV